MFDFLSKKFASIFDRIGQKHLTEDNIKETVQTVVEALLEADVPHDLAQAFAQDLQREVIGKKITKSLKPGEQFVKIMHDRLKQFLGGGEQEVEINFDKPAKILVMGLQGSGKTTSIAKLAHLVQQKSKKKILLASVDFYRPAAVDQLEQLAQKIAVDFYRSTETDPVKATAQICTIYQKERYDMLFLDTAGRLHIDNTMLKELRQIKQLVVPQSSFLVLDAMTGQESLNVAKAFDQEVGFDHAMLTKMDSDTRGGAAFSFRYALKKPIMYVGMGEKMGDIERFRPERMAGRILDMGDIVTLAERAEKQIKASEQESLMAAMSSGRFSLKDFAKQMEMMDKLGSMSSMMKYLPGMGSLNISADMVQKGESDLKKFKALISSMTQKEQKTPKILNESRKMRIARGAGLLVADLNLLLSRFEEIQQYVKLLGKFGRGQRFFG